MQLSYESAKKLAGITPSLSCDGVTQPVQPFQQVQQVQQIETSTKAEEDRRALMGFALRHLARREHSRVELRRKLISRGAADELVDAIIEGLTADGSLSDRRFAAEYVRARIRKGYGPIRIRMDLIERGINDQLAEEQLTQPADFWYQRATEVCNKKFDATKPAGEESADAQQRRWNRCARFLSQRGFPADLIYQTLDGRIAD